MIDFAKLITTEREGLPPRVLLHGIHKIGKSTFAAAAPNPIFIQTEDGLTEIKVPALPLCKTLGDVWDQIGWLIEADHKYRTVVIDTADWLEKLIHAAICNEGEKKSIEEYGYGKGYVMAMIHWDRLIRGLDKLHKDRGMGIIILAHTEVKMHSPPGGDPFDRYQIKLHKTAAARLEEWSDCILFANMKVLTVKDKLGKVKAINAEQERVIYCQPRPAWRAGSRYNLPDELPLSFKAFSEALATAKEQDNG